jgi:hypothetical protein
MRSHEGIDETSENEQVLVLRSILEQKQGLPVTYEEAQAIAESLIDFYELLADWTTEEGRHE